MINPPGSVGHAVSHAVAVPSVSVAGGGPRQYFADLWSRPFSQPKEPCVSQSPLFSFDDWRLQMRGWVTDWEVGVDGQLCPHHTAGSPSPSITRGGLPISYQWSPGPRQPPPACLFPFPGRLAQPPCGEERAERGWPGPGLTSQQLLQRLRASRHRLALRGPRVSQRVGAGTCSVHTLSAGAALHGAGGRPWKHRSGGALPSEVPPSGSLFSFPEPSLCLEICGPTLPI